MTSTNGKRPVPYDEDAERAILGAALYSSAAAETLVATVSPNDFYVTKHQHIAHAVSVAYLEGKPSDPVTIADRLRLDNLLDLVGPDYLVGLVTATPLSSNAAGYAEIIVRDAQRRERLRITEQISDAERAGTDTSNLVAQLVNVGIQAGTAELEWEDVEAALDGQEGDAPTILHRSDKQALLYPSAVNAIQSEPTIGKSWCACIAAAEVLNAGGEVVYLDYEDILRRMSRRVLACGATRASLIARFHYTRPKRLSPAGIATLPTTIARINADLVILDSVAESIATQGYNENDAPDVLAWWTSIVRPIARTGACVLLLDHLTKAKDGRGRYARGSGGKLAAADGAVYNLDLLESYSREKGGRMKLTISKDRHGVVGAIGDIAGIVNIDPRNHGETIDHSIAGSPLDDHGAWEGPTDCMAAIVELLTHTSTELVASEVPKKLRAINPRGWRDRVVYEALERLAVAGEIVARKHGRGTYYRCRSESDHHGEMF